VGFWKFYGQASFRAIKAAWDIGHKVHFLGILIEGGLVWFGIHLGKYELAIALPLLALLAAFLLGIAWQAYVIYLQEHKNRAALESKIAQEKKPIRMSATQLWELFRTDPVGSATLRMIQVSGTVSYMKRGLFKGGTEVHLSAGPLQDGKIVACYLDQQVNVRDYILLEGEVGEYNPQAQGGVITLLNCRLIPNPPP